MNVVTRYMPVLLQIKRCGMACRSVGDVVVGGVCIDIVSYSYA